MSSIASIAARESPCIDCFTHVKDIWWQIFGAAVCCVRDSFPTARACELIAACRDAILQTAKKIQLIFCRSSFRVAAGLDVHLVEKYERPFCQAFTRLQKHAAYELFKKWKALASDEAGKEYFRKSLSLGCCFGQIHELLKIAAKTPSDLTCQALLSKIVIEELYYYQMLQEITTFFGSHLPPEFEAYTGYAESPQSPPPSGPRGPLALLTVCNALYSELYDPSICWNHRQKLDDLIHEREVTGAILVTEGREGHALFFQWDQRACRFYDPIHTSEGFYEFSDRQFFLFAIKAHLSRTPHYSLLVRK